MLIDRCSLYLGLIAWNSKLVKVLRINDYGVFRPQWDSYFNILSKAQGTSQKGGGNNVEEYHEMSSGHGTAITHINSLQLWMPAQTCTKSSQQSQSAFQQMVLIGLNGLQRVCGIDMNMKWEKMIGTA